MRSTTRKIKNFLIKLLLPTQLLVRRPNEFASWFTQPVVESEFHSLAHSQTAKIIHEKPWREKSPSQIETSNLQSQCCLRQRAQNDALFAERPHFSS